MKINERGELLCPKCGGNFLHLEAIESYERMNESLTISFWCEFCHCLSRLELKQHKGNTEVRHADCGKWIPR